MRLGALNWNTFFRAHPDTPGKLAAFAYAFEHLEIGGHEQLKRVALRAGEQKDRRSGRRDPRRGTHRRREAVGRPSVGCRSFARSGGRDRLSARVTMKDALLVVDAALHVRARERPRLARFVPGACGADDGDSPGGRAARLTSRCCTSTTPAATGRRLTLLRGASRRRRTGWATSSRRSRHERVRASSSRHGIRPSTTRRLQLALQSQQVERILLMGAATEDASSDSDRRSRVRPEGDDPDRGVCDRRRGTGAGRARLRGAGGWGVRLHADPRRGGRRQWLGRFGFRAEHAGIDQLHFVLTKGVHVVLAHRSSPDRAATALGSRSGRRVRRAGAARRPVRRDVHPDELTYQSFNFRDRERGTVS